MAVRMAHTEVLGPPRVHLPPVQLSRAQVFGALWLASIALIGGSILLARAQRETPTVVNVFSILGLLALNVSLFRWWQLPAATQIPSRSTTNGRRLAFSIALLVSALFLLGLMALFPLAIAYLVVKRPRLSFREILFAGTIAAIAFVGGMLGSLPEANLAAPGFHFVYSLDVVAALLAGWTIARATGLTAAGIGRSRFLTEGAVPALRSFAFGIVFSLPWALSTLAARAFEGDNVNQWWEPMAALQPGFAEEAWGHVLLIPILFAVFCRHSTSRAAILSAVLVGTLWFAFIQATSPLATLVNFSVSMLPMTYFWLRRDLETAFGYHFWTDFVRFSGGYLFTQGMWFGG